VVDQLDLSAIESVYEEEDRGQPPYHPRMMTKILVYGYCVGVGSSPQGFPIYLYTDPQSGLTCYVIVLPDSRAFYCDKHGKIVAKIQRSGSAPPHDMIPAGWLPNHRVAKEWLSFVKRPEHPVTSLP